MRPGRIILSLQAALSVILVAGAGLFGSTLWRLTSLNPGFNPKGVAVIAVDTDKHPTKGAARIQLYDHLLQKIHAIPGVSAASIVWIRPLSNGGWDDAITIPGRTDLTEEQRDTYMNLVGPEYFKAMQTPLLRGRDFSPADTQATEKVGILSEIAAQRFFPNQQAVGSHIEVNNSLIRIVGVVGDAKYQSLQERDPATLYFPFTQATGDIPSMNFIVRTSSATSNIYPAFYAAVHQVAPDAPVGTMRTMEEQLNDSLGKERLLATLSVFFGVIALLLTSVGLYGVLTYAVVRRSAEIGVRMALGAQQRDVILLILRETIGHVGFGILAGIVAVLMTSKLVANLLYGIQPNDKGNLMLAIGLFLAVAAAAAYFPARRSTRLDPLLALREE
jgi:predicted permease